MAEPTESENAFQRYLDSQNMPWEKLPETQHKQPDYRIRHKGKSYIFEVKEFDDPPIKPVGGFSPCPAIREKISQARKQFKKYRENSCTLVLWSRSIYRAVMLETVAAAAFGGYVSIDRQRTTDLGAEPPRFQYYGPAELRETQNTTISAIAILGPYVLNHLWLETWRVLRKRQLEGEEITPWLQFDILQQLSAELPRTFSYEGTT